MRLEERAFLVQERFGRLSHDVLDNTEQYKFTVYQLDPGQNFGIPFGNAEMKLFRIQIIVFPDSRA